MPNTGVSACNKIFLHHIAKAAAPREDLSMRDNTPCVAKAIINGRNWQLDSLRALAVTSVLIHRFWPTCVLEQAGTGIGHLGVRLFFVLSGYLITGILLRCRSSMEAGQSDAATNLRRFYIRRFLRIFPPYYALLALMVIRNFPGVRDTLWWHAGYASNFLFALEGDWKPGDTSHFWSLAVEEQFYLVWPFLILLVPRSRLVAVVIAITVSSPLFRLIGFVAGVNETVVVLALACLVAKTAEGFGGLTGRLLSLRPLQYVGKISYGIYLYHVFVLQAFWKLLSVAHLPPLDKGPVLFLIVTSVTVAMAALSWKFLEEPLNGLKRYFPYELKRVQGGADSSFFVSSVEARSR